MYWCLKDSIEGSDGDSMGCRWDLCLQIHWDSSSFHSVLMEIHDLKGYFTRFTSIISCFMTPQKNNV